MWTNLLKTALSILDAKHIEASEWTLGGGTVLAYYFNHRESKDIDIFIQDAQYITMLSPRLNTGLDFSDGDYEESSNYLKLRYKEGEIDFILSPSLTDNPFKWEELMGRHIRVETPTEIIMKKLFYRSYNLKTRDIIDIAVVYSNYPQELMSQASILKNSKQPLVDRWDKIKNVYHAEAKGLKVFDTSIIDRAPAIFEKFIMELTSSF